MSSKERALFVKIQLQTFSVFLTHHSIQTTQDVGMHGNQSRNTIFWTLAAGRLQRQPLSCSAVAYIARAPFRYMNAVECRWNDGYRYDVLFCNDAVPGKCIFLRLLGL